MLNQIFFISKKVPADAPIWRVLSSYMGCSKGILKKITRTFGCPLSITLRDLSDVEFKQLESLVKKPIKEQESLKFREYKDILSKKKINCYQGLRHKRALPVHGQRSRSNAKSQKKLNLLAKYEYKFGSIATL
jgi:small subunit ribosomal protein S13